MTVSLSPFLHSFWPWTLSRRNRTPAAGNSVAPVISGIPMPGGTLVGAAGTWSGSPALTYRWQEDIAGTWTDITGETDPGSLALVLSDEGKVIRLLEIPNGNAGSAVASNSMTVGNAIAWWDAANASNTLETVSVNFLPGAVDTGTDKVTMAVSGFAFSTYEMCSVYFSTTGTLPGGLAENTRYIAGDNGDGTFSFWPYHTAADYSQFETFLPEERLPPGTSYVFGINKINLTTQGTGTHTMYTRPLATTVTDKSGQNINFDTSDRKKKFEVLSDGTGTYLWQDGGLGGFEPQGKANGTTGKNTTEIGNLMVSQRYLWSISVIEPIETLSIGVSRVIFDPVNVNISTGVINKANTFTTGSKITVGAWGGSFPIPTVPFASTIYVRQIDANNFSLHPTSADASANTNVYTYSNSGTGKLVAIKNAFSSYSDRRSALFDLSISSNDHAYAPIISKITTSISLSSNAYFMAAGFGNGNLNFIFDGSHLWNGYNIHKLNLVMPESSVGPICLDTGLPLTGGVYWMTKQPSSSYRRFHRTYADAFASVGVATNSLSSTQCIKYGALGTGQAGAQLMDYYIFRNFDDGFIVPSTTPLIPYGVPVVMAMMVDFDGTGDGKRRFFSGWNDPSNVWNHMENAVSAKNAPIPAPGAFTSLTLSNTGQPHISGSYKHYETIFGRATSDPSVLIQKCMAELKDKYGV